MLISANTLCTRLVTHGMLVTLVTFIYRFVCCDMSTLLDHIFQCQWGEVSEIRCIHTFFFFFIVVFFFFT